MKILVALFLSLLTVAAVARELEGVKMPDEIQVRGQKLTLVGMGVREVEVLHIDVNVYVAGLYLEHKDYFGRDISHNGDDIIKSQGLKEVLLQFKHHVSPSQGRESWENGIKANCGDQCAKFKDALSSWKGFMPSVNSGDTMAYIFDDKGVEVEYKGAKIGEIDNRDFANIILSVFIGAHPATQDLKKGLLAQ